MSEFEKNLILNALEKTSWVKNRAADLLKIKRTTLVEKIKRYSLEKPDRRFVNALSGGFR